VAHQWFYGILGNDVFNQPWLDESFANFSPYLVEGDRYGAGFADSYLQSNVIGPASRTTLPAGYSVYRYGDWNTYVSAVYGKGAQFLYMLRTRIGETAFHNGMRTYYARHKYGIVRRADFLRVMEEASGQDLDAFFAQWLGQ
jgi:aminopeptidase N